MESPAAVASTAEPASAAAGYINKVDPLQVPYPCRPVPESFEGVDGACELLEIELFKDAALKEAVCVVSLTCRDSKTERAYRVSLE